MKTRGESRGTCGKQGKQITIGRKGDEGGGGGERLQVWVYAGRLIEWTGS